MKNLKTSSLFILLFSSLAFPAWAEVFRVLPENIQFQIQGRTNEEALRRFIQWDHDRSFTSWDELLSYVEESKRKIANSRLFARVETQVTLNGEESIPLVIFQVTEPEGLGILASNTLLLPVVTYNTNTGLIAGGGYQDQNFLGNMAEFRLNGEYRNLSTGSQGAWVFGSWTIPLEPEPMAADLFLGFNLGLDISGQSFSHLEARYKKNLYPGLKSLINLRLGVNPWSGGLTGETALGLEYQKRMENLSSLWTVTQGYSSPEEGPDRNWLKSEVSTVQTWDFRTYLGYFGSTKFQWEGKGSYFFWPGTEIQEESRKGLVLSSKPTFSLDGVYWDGIFRSGGLFRLGHTWAFRPWDGHGVENTGIAEIQVHLHQYWAGISLRILGDQAFSGVREKGGKDLRGILDDSIISLSRGTVNLDIPLRLPLGPVSQALEVMLVPFLDSAMVMAAGESGKPSGFYQGGGAELILVPAFAKTALIRLSMGWNLTPGETFNPSPGEIALDLSHFY